MLVTRSSPRASAFLEYFCPKQGQDFKPSAAPLYPNMGQVPPGTLGLSDVMKGLLFTFFQVRYMRFFEWQDMESVIFRAPLVVKKYSLFDPLGKKEQVRQCG